MGQTKFSREEVEQVLSKIKFMDRAFRLLNKGDGYLLQMRYLETDVERPGSKPVEQSTRKWYISPYMSESEIVETAWACVQRSQLHVASEHFTYYGKRIYSQHFNVSARMEICDVEDYDVRKPL